MNVKTDEAIDSLTDSVVSDAKKLINRATKKRNRRERSNRSRVARLFNDEDAIGTTITLTDEVMRIKSSRAATRILRSAARKSTIKGFGLIDAIGLRFIGQLSRLIPEIVIKIVYLRVRLNSRDLILDSRQSFLSRFSLKRRALGLSLNINILGEAVLGHVEAQVRYESIVEMIKRPEVDYVSVKLSSIVAQLVTIDVEGSRQRSAERLRELYRIAREHNVFVNLDMEEYRDLDMTVSAFTSVLSENEFLNVNAGIVLQAYLPESHKVLGELIEWSKSRHEKHGAHIKIRIVKGANLAMERAEAEIHGWDAAPYKSKADVDASYLRLLDAALRRENAQAVRIGLASHNIFHLAWALSVAKSRNVREQMDIEMLEGMANGEALALVERGESVLLYAPVTKPEDFSAAVAYLVRRLDENTSPDNYLRAAFDIERKSQVFKDQENRFRQAVSSRHTLATSSLRHLTESRKLISGDITEFKNHPELDPTEPTFQKSLESALHVFASVKDWHIPVIVGGKEYFEGNREPGTDPSDNGKIWYHYAVGNKKLIDEALKIARQGLLSWGALSNDERSAILKRSAQVMQSKECETIAVMARDTGKSTSEAIPEISEAIDFANYYATNSGEFSGSQPMGIVLVVPPWNFPYAIPIGGICAALAAGNVVILKPAPEAVATAFELINHLWEGGVPKEVLQFLPMRDDEDGKYLVSHPDLNAVILTGSFETAELFLSWRPAMNLLAETSGKNSMLISACADIDVAVKDLVHSAFGHAGQKCSAASVAIVDTTIYNNPAFFRQIKDAVTSLSVGSSLKFKNVIGPVIRKPEGPLLRALSQLEPGEEWLVKPEKLDDAGLIWSPGVKIGVQAGSWTHQNEWFGPVLGIIEAPDFATALNWQNQTNFGLTAGLQSLDTGESEEWISQIEAGNIYINRGITGAIVNRQPFGGWKRSSVGPNSKAGGLNYVNSLRNWHRVTDVRAAKFGAEYWWANVGTKAIDHSGLNVEKNFHRYCRHKKPILVVIDDMTSKEEKEFVRFIAALTKIDIVMTEDLSLLDGDYAKVRWLSSETAPTSQLIARGISVDHRPITQRGDIETPRWLLEQSVSVTNHRYGNVNGGPKPTVPGLQ
jgi:RHH-type proline utilization regulon transcriptional repressor/proline dehydrogenase/delta 1-pyrroline-5-carboxylate dehydrogenase